MPYDPNKTDAGLCGCGTPDTDTDSDGTPDCLDQCPHDAHHLTPGQCGCVGETNLEAAGTACSDGLCSENDECDGQGSCGSPTQCLPSPNCVLKVYDSHAYTFCPTDSSWQTARSTCTALSGTDLAHIDNAAEDAFIYANIVAPAWIGANDIAIEGKWVWSDDGTQFWSGKWNGSAVGGRYSNWDFGQPDDLFFNQDCAVHKKFVNEWIDEDCSAHYDFVCEVTDQCPSDPNKRWPGICGCGAADVDTDGDGALDCQEACPLDPHKQQPGACGCGHPDTDSDGDGVADCIDGCPTDPLKIAPGQCACGTIDTDSDADGVADCVDGCPSDSAKASPGQCGCSVADGDYDGDGVADCVVQLGHDSDGLSTALATVLQSDGPVPDFPTAADLGDKIDSAVALLVLAAPADVQLTASSSIRNEISALGRALSAMTLSSLERPIGLQPDGSRCPNVVVSLRQADGTFVRPPLSTHFDLVQSQSAKADLESTVHNLAALQVGISCMNDRDLSMVERGFVESFIQLQQALDLQGKHAVANAFWDYTLPSAILLYDATKYFQFPKSIQVLRYPTQPSTTLPPNWENFVPFQLSKAHDLYCRQQKQPLTLDRLGIWLEDVFNGGVMNRVMTIEDRSCDFLNKVTDLTRLGAGDCSLLEMSYTRYQCRSANTCQLPSVFDAGARPGEPNSPMTQFGTLRVDVQQLLCQQDAGFESNGSVSLAPLFPLSGCAADAPPAQSTVAALALCSITISSASANGPVALPAPNGPFFTPTRPRPLCNDPFKDDGGTSEPPPPITDPCTDGVASTRCDDPNDVTDLYKTELDAAAQDLSTKGPDALSVVKGIVGSSNVTNPTGVSQEVQSVIGAEQHGKVHLINTDLSGTGEHDLHCPSPCKIASDGSVTIQIDVNALKADRLAWLQGLDLETDFGSVAECEANAGCRGVLKDAVGVILSGLLEHELAHVVISQIEGRTDIITQQGFVHNKCFHTDDVGCRDIAEKFATKWGHKDCDPDQPCGNSTCGHGDGLFSRFAQCVSAHAGQEVPAWCPGPIDDPVLCTALPALGACFIDDWPNLWDQPVCQVTLCGPESSPGLQSQCCGLSVPDTLPPPASCTGSAGDPVCACCGVDGVACPADCLRPCVTCTGIVQVQ